MVTGVGEYLVGAYLQLIEKCDVVDYNVRAPGGGLGGLNELDVLGLDFTTQTAFLCEVTTHLRGLNAKQIPRLRKKFEFQQTYADTYLRSFGKVRFQYWSPRVPIGKTSNALHSASTCGLEFVINEEYASRIQQLQKLASSVAYDARNPVFRVLQILGHLRDG